MKKRDEKNDIASHVCIATFSTSAHIPPNPPRKRNKIQSSKRPLVHGQLKAIEAALSFLLLLHSPHSLFQLLSRLLSRDTHVFLLLDGLDGESGFILFLHQLLDFILMAPAFLLPTLHVEFDLVALRLEVNESFFERGGKLFLGEEMLFHLSDVGVLFFESGVVGGENFGIESVLLGREW